MDPMNIDFVTPVARARNLGQEYNRVMRSSGAEWVCVRDCDTMFLTPMAGVRFHMIKCIEDNPECGLFTCLTNRIFGNGQLLGNRFNEDPNVLNHIRLAEKRIAMEPRAIMTQKNISGFFMLIRKSTWEKSGGFKEGGGFLGVDNKFGEACRDVGSAPMIIQTIYLFHVYRLGKGKNYTKHLK